MLNLSYSGILRRHFGHSPINANLVIEKASEITNEFVLMTAIVIVT